MLPSKHVWSFLFNGKVLSMKPGGLTGASWAAAAGDEILEGADGVVRGCSGRVMQLEARMTWK